MMKRGLVNNWVRLWVGFPYFLVLAWFPVRFFDLNLFIIERVISALFLVLFLFMAVATKSLVLLKKQALFLGLGMLLLIWVCYKGRVEYPAPLLFFFFLLGMLYMQQNTHNLSLSEFREKTKILFHWLLVLHLLMYISGATVFFQQGSRFVGLMPSPTTFSTWMVACYLLAHGEYRRYEAGNKALAALAFFASLFFIFASGTRVSVLFMLFLAYAQLTDLMRGAVKTRAIAIITFAILVSSAYPVYEFLTQYLPSDILAFRYAGDVDTSAALRIVLHQAIWDSWVNSGLWGLLFGIGAGSSREVIFVAWGVDLLPHNDFIMLAHDFGIVFTVIFIGLLAAVASRSYMATQFCLLYVLSYLHNMAYSHYLIAIIVLFTMRSVNKKIAEVRQVSTYD